MNPTNKKEIPTIKKKELSIFLREFQAMTNIPPAIIILKSSAIV
jgi:hypothetical protein